MVYGVLSFFPPKIIVCLPTSATTEVILKRTQTKFAISGREIKKES